MIERIIRESAHRFRACDNCGHQPLHIAVRGRTRAEAVERPDTPCHRHQLECTTCGRRTAKHGTLAQAEVEWGVKFTALPLALPGSKRRKVA